MPYLLLVDDEEDGREALCRFLEHVGHEVTSVSNGRAALRSIFARMPDLIILDLMMPGMDGVNLLEVIRSYLRFHPLHVIMLTAFPDSPLLKRAKQLAVNRVLTKGKDSFDEILQAVTNELHGGFSPDDHFSQDFGGR
jgi:CheY-like chemotaxis protein